MKKVQAYKSKDGHLFENKEECKRYEVGLKALDDFTKMVDKSLFSQADKHILAQFLMGNAKPLAAILNNLWEDD